MNKVISLSDYSSDYLSEKYDETHAKLITQIRFYTYSITGTAIDGTRVHRHFIVLRNTNGIIVYFTELEQYILSYSRRSTRPVLSNDRKKVIYITKMLNYILIDNYQQYHIKDVYFLTPESVLDFIAYYCETENPQTQRRPGQTSISFVQSTISSFLETLKKRNQLPNFHSFDLFKDKKTYVSGIQRSVRVSNLNARSYHSSQTLKMKDMPTPILFRLLELSKIYDPTITLALAFQAFGGLRASEVCNVRKMHGINGSGIKFQMRGGRLIKVTIDLTQVLPMRSDSVVVGSIKRPRTQDIYPVFLPYFQNIYDSHIKLINTMPVENRYDPLLLNLKKEGNVYKALTYQSYQRRFKRLISILTDELLKSSDPNDQLYGELLITHTAGTHLLRHFFSVQLVLHGEDTISIMHWRGDSNPDSAAAYLKDKGELTKIYKRVGDIASRYVIGGTDD